MIALLVLIGLVASVVIAVLVNHFTSKDRQGNKHGLIAGIAAMVVIQTIAQTALQINTNQPPQPTAALEASTALPTPHATQSSTSPTGPPTASGSSSAEPTTPSPLASTAPIPQPEQTGPEPVWLSDIEPDQFIRYSNHLRRGPVSIDGEGYPKSYSFEFTNCSNCKAVDEVRISRSYTRLTGRFGLTDDSRHDDVIDGVVYVSIYAGSQQLFGPKKVEYPGSVKIDIAISASRLIFEVEGGTNYETAAWADVKLR